MKAPAWLLLIPAVALGIWAATSCDEPRHSTSEPPQTTEPSPNASILPAPLASEVEPDPKSSPPPDAEAPADAGVFTTRFLREDSAVDVDFGPREATGVRLTTRMRWLDLPPFPRLPDTNLEAALRLREALAFELVVELSAGGRMRVSLNSDAFVWPRGTELRARLDRVGNVLVWNENTAYTVLPVGTLRAALSEGRPDAVPLSKPKLVMDGGGNVLGTPTERIELSTPIGRLLIEQALLPNAGASGKLWCRFLTELVAAEPLNAACDHAYVPLRAELFSRAGGHVLIETLRIEREHVTLDAATLQTPPPTASFHPLEIPTAPTAQVPSNERLRELRLHALPRTEKPDPAAPKDGLVIQNRGDGLRYLLLDGLAVARVAPRSELKLQGLLPGKYALATLDFLGDDPTPLRIVELPARVALGDEP